MRSIRSLRQAQLAVYWLFPIFFVAILYRTSQMLDWDQPGPIGDYFSLVLQYPVLNLLAATVGIVTVIALLAQFIGGFLLIRSGDWVLRAFVVTSFLAPIAGSVLYFGGDSLEGMLVIVACLELVAGVLLVRLFRSSAADATREQQTRRGIGRGSVLASTVTVVAMCVGLGATSLWAGIIWVQGQDLEPNALVAAVVALAALITLGWGIVSFLAAPKISPATP